MSNAKPVPSQKMYLFRMMQDMLIVKEEFDETLIQLRQSVVSVALEHEKLADCFLERLERIASYAGNEHLKDRFDYVNTMYIDDMKSEEPIFDDTFREIEMLRGHYDHAVSFAGQLLQDLNKDLQELHEMKPDIIKRRGLKQHFQLVEVYEIAEQDIGKKPKANPAPKL